MRKALENLPRKLDDAFESSVARIDAQPKALRDLAHRLIGWIVSAERPLRKIEVLHAFAVDPGDEEVDDENIVMLTTLLRACAGLVTVDDDRATFGMVHVLAYEFFQGRYLGTTEIHEDIARTSLAYLGLKMLKSGPCSTLEDMDNRLRDLPFLQYAARNWGKHASNPGTEQTLREYIQQLLEEPQLRSSAFQALNYRTDISNRDILAAVFDSLPKGQSQLHIAAYWGLNLTLKELVGAGADSNVTDSQGWSPLNWATSNGHIDTMGILLESGADVNHQDEQGWTPLTWASFNGSVPAAELVLGRKAQHLMTDVHGWTALHWAVSRQNQEVVQLLMEHHQKYLENSKSQPLRTTTIPPTKSSHVGGSRTDSAIELAAASGDTKIFNLLIKNGDPEDKTFNCWWGSSGFDPPMSNTWRTMNKAESMYGIGVYISRRLRYGRVDKDPEQWKATMLHSAIKDDKLEIVQLLISIGADVNADSLDRSALHAAACKRDPRFAQILIENHADVSALDTHRQTALHQAILNGFQETVSALIKGGADVNARTSSTSRQRNYARPRLSIDISDKGMEIELGRDAVRLTPLMLAAGYRIYSEKDLAAQSNIFKTLLSHKADVSLTDEGGRTCLHMVAPSGSQDIVRQLLAAGAEVNARDSRQAVPLHYATQFGNVAMTQALIDAGADIDACNSSGIAMIHSAALSCNLDVLRPLIDRGVQVLSVDNSGRNAINYFATGSNRKVDLDDLRQIFHWLYPTPDLSRLNAAYDRYETSGRFGSSDSLSRKHTPLSRTIKDGNWKVFGILREAGGDIPAPSGEYINQAVSDIQPLALQYLLERGGLSEMKEHFERFKPDFYISESTNFDDLDAMLPNVIGLGMDINNKSYDTKLSGAAKRIKSAQVAQVLLKHGADPYDGHPVLDSFLLAASHQNSDFLHSLLVHAPKPAPEGHWIHHLSSDTIAQSEELERVCIALQQSDSMAKQGGPFFASAVRNRSERLARLLIAHGLEIEMQDEHGWTPLHHAVLYEATPAVKDLLELGANVNVATTCWWTVMSPRPSGLYQNSSWTGTALHLAALMGNEEIARMLLDHGADVEASARTDYESEFSSLHGPKALRIALGTGTTYGINTPNLGGARLRIARMLLEKGASVEGVANHLRAPDLPNFEGFEDVWDRVRQGLSEKE